MDSSPLLHCEFTDGSAAHLYSACFPGLCEALGVFPSHMDLPYGRDHGSFSLSTPCPVKSDLFPKMATR